MARGRFRRRVSVVDRKVLPCVVGKRGKEGATGCDLYLLWCRVTMQEHKVWFVGAGPGDPDLITVRGRALLSRAGAVLYAGSLVSADHLPYAPPDCVVQDSSGLTLPAMVAWLHAQVAIHPCVVRLQTGDPSLYGALTELASPLLAAGVAVGVVPGVSSAMAAAAAGCQSLTFPSVTQTVIFTRPSGRTPVPSRERLRDLARHRTTLCLFLAAGLLSQVTDELLDAGWAASDLVLVVYRASWPGEEQVFHTPLGELALACQARGVDRQLMVIASPAIGVIPGAEGAPGGSCLYDPHFTHGARGGTPCVKPCC